MTPLTREKEETEEGGILNKSQRLPVNSHLKSLKEKGRSEVKEARPQSSSRLLLGNEGRARGTMCARSRGSLGTRTRHSKGGGTPVTTSLSKPRALTCAAVWAGERFLCVTATIDCLRFPQKFFPEEVESQSGWANQPGRSTGTTVK